MKILHSPINALYQPSLMVQGLRKLNVDADLMIYTDSFASFRLQAPEPTVLGTSDLSTASLSFFQEAIEKYDVFHFHSGYSPLCLSRKAKELRFLSKLNKVIAISRWGCCDGRTPSSWQAERSLCSVCPAKWSACSDDLNSMRLERENKYADIIINHECEFNEFNSRAVFLHGSIDIEVWHPDLTIPEEFKSTPKSKGTTRIIHAVGGMDRGDVKGSRWVQTAIDQLKKKGLKTDYQKIAGIPFLDLRWHILQADIVIDQLRYGSFGSFARESLALGKTVVGHIQEDQRALLHDIPIVEASGDNLDVILEELVTNQSRREALGRAGREYAEKHFCHLQIAQHLSGLYAKAMNQKLNDVTL